MVGGETEDLSSLPRQNVSLKLKGMLFAVIYPFLVVAAWLVVI